MDHIAIMSAAIEAEELQKEEPTVGKKDFFLKVIGKKISNGFKKFISSIQSKLKHEHKEGAEGPELSDRGAGMELWMHTHETTQTPAYEGFFFKKKNKAPDEHDMQEMMIDWLKSNQGRLKSGANGPTEYLVTMDDDTNHANVRYIASQVKEQVCWDQEIPLMTFAVTMKGEKTPLYIAMLRENWNSMKVVAMGVLYVTLNTSFEEMRNAPKDKPVGLEANLRMDVYWQLGDTTIANSPKSVIMLGGLQFGKA